MAFPMLKEFFSMKGSFISLDSNFLSFCKLLSPGDFAVKNPNGVNS